MELSYTEPMKNTIYGGAVYMELHELVDMANEDEEYVLAVIESREPNDYSLMCTVETYERAKEYPFYSELKCGHQNKIERGVLHESCRTSCRTC